MRKFYKCYTESYEGEEGWYYCEVVDGLIVRQVNVFGPERYWATPQEGNDERYDFTDQPEFQSTKTDKEISENEFMDVWTLAVNPRSNE